MSNKALRWFLDATTLAVVLQDVDKDGEVEYTEFIAATLEARGNIEEERIAEAFDTIDTNNTGYITPENLNQSMNHDSDTRFAQESLKNMLEEADMDKDGKSE